MKKSMLVILALLVCAVFAQTVAAEIVRSTKIVATNAPGIGRYLEAYHTNSSLPNSAQRYLGSGNVVQLRIMEEERYKGRTLARQSRRASLFDTLILQRDLRRKAQPGYREYKWGVSAPPTIATIKAGLQPVPANAMPVNPESGGTTPSMTPEGTPTGY